MHDTIQMHVSNMCYPSNYDLHVKVNMLVMVNGVLNNHAMIYILM